MYTADSTTDFAGKPSHELGGPAMYALFGSYPLEIDSANQTAVWRLSPSFQWDVQHPIVMPCYFELECMDRCPRESSRIQEVTSAEIAQTRLAGDGVVCPGDCT